MALHLELNPISQMKRLHNAASEKERQAQAYYLRTIIAKEFAREVKNLDKQYLDVPKVLVGLETLGFDLEERFSLGALSTDSGYPWKILLWPAYRLRRSLLGTIDLKSQKLDFMRSLFAQSLDGVVANRQPELRLQLSEADLDTSPTEDTRWDEFLEWEIKRSFLLTTRKSGDRVDLEKAARIIKRLRKEQLVREPSLTTIRDPYERRLAAVRTLALYHCAKAVEITNEFVRGLASYRGITDRGIKSEISRFIFNAREILSGIDSDLRMELSRLERACHASINSSVFALTLPQSVEKFVREQASRRGKPILELWFAQREAINARLLDPTRTAIVLSLPTSSGKTLLAEMAIVQAHSDRPKSRIIYLAPTRALVTQMALTMKRDFQSLNISVIVATPAFELSPVESEVLEGGFDVMVTTPEKLDLLIRSNHSSVDDLSLVVVDEAHNLADSERGSRLELLLATLRRERPRCRFLLMTPFAQNAGDLARWLGSTNGTSLVLDWKPNDRVLGAVKFGRKKRGLRSLVFQTLDTPHSDFPPGIEIPLGTLASEFKASKERIAIECAVQWSEVKRGGVLLLCSSPDKAVSRAKAIASNGFSSQKAESVDIITRFLDTEAGTKHPLSDLIEKGVAFHHAGLSPEARYLVERLVEEGQIRIICATTTLAQGVHFPLSAAVIETFHRSRPLSRGRWLNESIRPWEFWNIAGRVGRTLEDAIGYVAFATVTTEQVEAVQTYLKKDAHTVVSSLLQALQELKGQDIDFAASFLMEHVTLSSFLQYLLHAISVIGENQIRNTHILEDLLRGSFAYQEAQRISPEVADQLIRWARLYVDHLRKKKGKTLAGFAKIADGTGFSSPSVDIIWRNWKGSANTTDWYAGRLFPATKDTSELLTQVVITLGQIPEIRLGSRERGLFDPERVSRVTNAWVNGLPIRVIADREYNGNLIECTRHIYSTISTLIPWGVRAVQRVGFSGQTNVDWSELDLLPAMIVHGVRSREAVGLRMLNVPRMVAEGLANIVRKETVKMTGLDNWLNQSSPDSWDRSLPKGAAISGAECKTIWQILDGQRPWQDLGD